MTSHYLSIHPSISTARKLVVYKVKFYQTNGRSAPSNIRFRQATYNGNFQCVNYLFLGLSTFMFGAEFDCRSLRPQKAKLQGWERWLYADVTFRMNGSVWMEARFQERNKRSLVNKSLSKSSTLSIFLFACSSLCRVGVSEMSTPISYSMPYNWPWKHTHK